MKYRKNGKPIPKSPLGSYPTWEEAYAAAQPYADASGQCCSIEQNKLFKHWSVGFLPNDPSKRFGHELRVECVTPSLMDSAS